MFSSFQLFLHYDDDRWNKSLKNVIRLLTLDLILTIEILTQFFLSLLCRTILYTWLAIAIRLIQQNVDVKNQNNSHFIE